MGFAGCGGSGDGELSGGGGATATPSASADPDRPVAGGRAFSSMDEVLAQEVRWKRCPDNEELRCASIRVPLDYDDLGAGTTVVKMNKWPAAGAKQGALFLNPGGPGGSGLEELVGRLALSQAQKDKPDPLHRRFDQIGFDPRGVQASSPVTCLDAKRLDAYLATSQNPKTDGELQQLKDASVKLGEGCARNPLSAHMSSVEVAKDLDVMRQLVGEEKLNYLGSSYGTRLGATYAALYPDKTGQMVLDGAISPTVSNHDAEIGQLRGFQIALDDWSQDCVEEGKCPLGDDRAAVFKAIDDVLSAADKQPLETKSKDGRKVTESLALYGIVAQMYARLEWSSLTDSLVAARKGDGTALLAAADQFVGRDESGKYPTNSTQAEPMVNCLDYGINGLGAPVTKAEATKASPVLGPWFWGAGQGGCQVWPIKTAIKPPDYTAAGAPPILVVGTTGDPATPYYWAQDLADVLDSGVLLTRKGEGHTGFEQGSRCTDDAVRAFLVRGTVPEEGTTCRTSKNAL